MRTASTLWPAILALTFAGACSSGQTAGEATRASPSFEGTFDVVYAQTNGDGTPKAEGQRKETWVSKSTCRESGCVAEVAVLDPNTPDAPRLGTRTFDFVDGHWQNVLSSPGRCKAPEGDVDVDNWSVISLDPEQDNKFDGFFRWASAPRLCTGQQSVTVTRAKATVEADVPDPAATPPFVSSPAQALHGRYRYIQSFEGKDFEPRAYQGDTTCLRDGQRCLTYMSRPGTEFLLVMVFEDGTWILNAPTSDADCPGGAGKSTMEAFDEFPLPKPPQDPITLLTGGTTQTYAGDCPGNSELGVRLERIGD